RPDDQEGSELGLEEQDEEKQNQINQDENLEGNTPTGDKRLSTPGRKGNQDPSSLVQPQVKLSQDDVINSDNDENEQGNKDPEVIVNKIESGDKNNSKPQNLEKPHPEEPVNSSKPEISINEPKQENSDNQQ